MIWCMDVYACLSELSPLFLSHLIIWTSKHLPGRGHFTLENRTKHTTLPKLKPNNTHCTHHLQRAIEVHQYKQYQFIRSNHWTVYSVGIWVNLNIYMDQGSLYASITIKILAESLTLQTIYSWWFRQTHFHHQSETLHQPVSTRCFNKIK